ncbi:MAG: anaerobic ribonucleoside-triphosphate reductase activating protein [Clostridiales bacterium]|nr:anaerobic ribonucleoside-triphosphate reductase activating protein [Clostridiales bacterium]
MTLLDFPGKVACTVFLHGCNMRCPFCHNSELIAGQMDEAMSQEAFAKFLSSRKELLDGVCISGGEPTLSPILPELLMQIKSLGFSAKLDTNGTQPKVIQKLVSQGLVDYIAMDIKNGPSRYAQTVGLSSLDLSPIEESIQYLVDGHTAYEFRTTLVQPFHDEASIIEMGQWLSSLVPGKKPEKLYLQSFVDRDTVLFSGLCAPDPHQIERYALLLAPYAGVVSVRGF